MDNGREPVAAKPVDAGPSLKLERLPCSTGQKLNDAGKAEAGEAGAAASGGFQPGEYVKSDKRGSSAWVPAGKDGAKPIDEERIGAWTATVALATSEQMPRGLGTAHIASLASPAMNGASKSLAANAALEVAVLAKGGELIEEPVMEEGRGEDPHEGENSKKRKAAVVFKTPATEGASGESARGRSERGEGSGGKHGAARPGEVPAKKAKKKGASRPKGSRKGGKKSGGKAAANGKKPDEDLVHVTPAPQHNLEDREMVLSSSLAHKAAQIVLSEDKLSASSWKGYRMVRATRGVVEGAWYFEIHLVHLGKTGHTRLGWSSWRADVQAPVGYDSHSYAYRDLEGAKVHEALRQPYGEPYREGDTLGCYISLPGGAALAPKPTQIVRWKGQPYYVEEEEGPKKNVPGSEVAFFRNGACQGTAFQDIYAGRYHPAASIYTLPEQTEKATVRFNFGPTFKYPPADWGARPVPQPMSEAQPMEPLVPDLEEEAEKAAAEAPGKGVGAFRRTERME